MSDRGELIATRIMILRPDAPPEIETLALPDDPTYLDLAKLLTPYLEGMLEHVAVLADFSGGIDYQPADLFVHERGRLLALPRNDAATVLYRRATMMGHTFLAIPAHAEELPWIAGVAVLFERRVWR